MSDMQVDESTGVVTWTPSSGTTSSGENTLVVTDGINSDEEVFTVTVGSSGNDDNDNISSDDDSDDSSESSGCFIQTSAQNSDMVWLKMAGVLIFVTSVLFSEFIWKKRRC
jgi:hypothetical protein